MTCVVWYIGCQWWHQIVDYSRCILWCIFFGEQCLWNCIWSFWFFLEFVMKLFVCFTITSNDWCFTVTEIHASLYNPEWTSPWCSIITVQLATTRVKKCVRKYSICHLVAIMESQISRHLVLMLTFSICSFYVSCSLGIHLFFSFLYLIAIICLLITACNYRDCFTKSAVISKSV